MFKKSLTCLVALMVLASALPASANGFGGTEENEATAALTKIFRMSENIETPGLTFTFEIKPVSVSGATYNGSNMPTVIDKTVTFNASDEGKIEDGVKQVYKETPSLFSGAEWKHAGVYVYEVTEKASVSGNLEPGETVEYSQAKYKLEVYVANGKSGLYVAFVGAEVIVTDGEPKDGQGAKVDATPGDPSVEGSFSKISFTNTFTKTKGSGKPTEPNLAISKKVDTKNGNGHDFADREKYFEFNVAVTKSGTNSNANPKYVVYVLNEKSEVVTSSANFNGTILTHNEYGDYFEFTSGQPLTVNLKHGEWLSFVDLEVDASYTVTESGTENFAPSCEKTAGGVKTSLSANSGQSLTVEKTYITMGEDRADFTNMFIPLTPVGVSIDNLPFFIFLGLGLLSLMLLVLFKKRDKEQEEQQEVQ